MSRSAKPGLSLEPFSTSLLRDAVQSPHRTTRTATRTGTACRSRALPSEAGCGPKPARQQSCAACGRDLLHHLPAGCGRARPVLEPAEGRECACTSPHPTIIRAERNSGTPPEWPRSARHSGWYRHSLRLPGRCRTRMTVPRSSVGESSDLSCVNSQAADPGNAESQQQDQPARADAADAQQTIAPFEQSKSLSTPRRRSLACHCA